jgi:hypothetical protein
MAEFMENDTRQGRQPEKHEISSQAAQQNYQNQGEDDDRRFRLDHGS